MIAKKIKKHISSMIVLSILEICVKNKVLWGMILRHIISSSFNFELLCCY